MAGILPLTKTKAGPGEKEPAFIVLRQHMCRVIAILVMLALLVSLKFWDSSARFQTVKLKLHGAARNLYHAEREHARAHAEMARVGEEFDEHLDRDLHELEAGRRLLHTIKSTHVAYSSNVTAILDLIMSDIRKSIEEGSDPLQSLGAAEEALRLKLTEAQSHLFDVQSSTVGALVRRLAEGAKEAQSRKGGLEGEIRNSLHDSVESSREHKPLVDDIGADWTENEGEEYSDDHWAKETERWHNQTVESFYTRLEEWLHPNISDTKSAPASSYDTSSELYQALKKAHDQLEEDVKHWREAQDLIHDRASDIAANGLPAYTDADEPDDDGYQGFQSWHVQSYLDDLLWPAELRFRLPELLDIKRQLDRGSTRPIDIIEILEGMVAENVVPHYWLHHGGHDYYYRGDDYY